MKITEDVYKNLTIRREEGEKRIYKESIFFHRVKQILNGQGHDLVRRDPSKEGHLTGAPYYLRDREWRYCYHDDNYAVRNIAEDFSDLGEVTLYYFPLEE